jgi:hypothetical protein
MDDVHLFSECFGDVCSQLGFRVLHGWYFSSNAPRAPLRAPLQQFKFSCACACARPAAHAFGERSTTALDRMGEGEKAQLPLILRVTSLLLSQLAGWRAEGDADPTVLLTGMPAVPDLVQLAPWLPVQPGASPRSGGPQPPVRGAAAAVAAATVTGPACSGPRPPVGSAAVAAARTACL